MQTFQHYEIMTQALKDTEHTERNRKTQKRHGENTRKTRGKYWQDKSRQLPEPSKPFHHPRTASPWQTTCKETLHNCKISLQATNIYKHIADWKPTPYHDGTKSVYKPWRSTDKSVKYDGAFRNKSGQHITSNKTI